MRLLYRAGDPDSDSESEAEGASERRREPGPAPMEGVVAGTGRGKGNGMARGGMHAHTYAPVGRVARHVVARRGMGMDARGEGEPPPSYHTNPFGMPRGCGVPFSEDALRLELGLDPHPRPAPALPAAQGVGGQPDGAGPSGGVPVALVGHVAAVVPAGAGKGQMPAAGKGGAVPAAVGNHGIVLGKGVAGKGAGKGKGAAFGAGKGAALLLAKAGTMARAGIKAMVGIILLARVLDSCNHRSGGKVALAVGIVETVSILQIGIVRWKDGCVRKRNWQGWQPWGVDVDLLRFSRRERGMRKIQNLGWALLQCSGQGPATQLC